MMGYFMISETITIATGNWIELQCTDTEERKDESGMPNGECKMQKCILHRGRASDKLLEGG